ncbi:bifunctional riboflavin kinase/FAD synthetase [Actinomycetaceae bacterium TAE3-ERU4]|nr:bifunctional riboflavin kinase/FAD synthetase [Actinomycetaceae bacterium TAE3-ERU4]
MREYTSIDQLPAGVESVVTIGIFDGLHRGHRHLISQVIKYAKSLGVQSWAVTFDPHPAHLHAPDRKIRLITSLRDRLNGMKKMGLDAVLIEPYTWELAGLMPEEFVRRYFVEGLGAKLVVVGRDVKFGKDNSGDLGTLRSLGEKYGFSVLVVDEQNDSAGNRYSSTRIRAALGTGDVQSARAILGDNHRVRGKVVHGLKRGRKLGFPTANLDAQKVGEIPADGVYAGWLSWVDEENKEHRFAAAISVGTNPHFDGEKRTIEAHVLGRADLNLYGLVVVVEFVSKLRDMATFASLEELLGQMDEDLRDAASILGVPAAGRVDPREVTAC